MGNQPAIHLVVRNAIIGVTSYAWRMWWHGSSFYLSPTLAYLSGIKVSLHGPDARHPTSGFKIAVDNQAMRRAVAAGCAYHVPDDGVWFEGRPMVAGVRHVTTLRWTPGLFHAGCPSAPVPKAPRANSVGRLLAAPDEGYATDVDIYVCRRRPWWPNEGKAILDNARLGPITNASGHSLTAVSVRRRLSVKQTPEAAKLVPPRSRGDKVRAIGSGVDERLLWIVEQWTSRERIDQHQQMLRADAATRPAVS